MLHPLNALKSYLSSQMGGSRISPIRTEPNFTPFLSPMTPLNPLPNPQIPPNLAGAGQFILDPSRSSVIQVTAGGGLNADTNAKIATNLQVLTPLRCLFDLNRNLLAI